MSFSVIQTIMGMIGSVGFAVLFGVRGRKLAVIARTKTTARSEERRGLSMQGDGMQYIYRSSGSQPFCGGLK